MHVNVGVWDKLSRLLILLLSLAGIVILYFWYLPLIQQNQRLRKDILTLDSKIAAEEKLGRHLRATIDAVQNDPQTLERMAREQLGFARPDETIIRFEVPARHTVP